MKKYKKRKNKSNKIIDKYFNYSLIILTITIVLHSIAIALNKNNTITWSKEIKAKSNHDDTSMLLYNNINIPNNNSIITNTINDKYINNQMLLSLGFSYALNNNLLHIDNGISYILESEMLDYINSMCNYHNTIIMEDIELDNNLVIYNSSNNRFEYINMDSNIEKASKIYTVYDNNYLYIYEYSAYTNLNLVKNNTYPSSYSNNNYNLGLYVNNDNINNNIEKLDLNKIVYTFKLIEGKYYLVKIDNFL